MDLRNVAAGDMAAENMIGTVSDDFIKIVQRALPLLRSENSWREKERWLKHIKYNIRLLNKVIKRGSSTIAVLIKLQSNLGHLKGFLVTINNMKHVSGGLNDKKRSSRVKWEDINSAFSSRTRRA